MLAKVYGSNHEESDFAIEEAVSVLIEEFGCLTFSDVRKAYRLAFSKKIDVKGFESYGGVFNLGGMIKILAAYQRMQKKEMYKRKIAELEAQDKRIRQLKEELRERKGIAYKLQFKQDMKRYAIQFDGYSKVYGWLFEVCKNQKLIDGCILNFMDQAKDLYNNELSVRANSGAVFKVIKHKKDPIILIAEKLAVWDLLVKLKKEII